MLLKNWMRKKPITVTEEDTLLDAKHIMEENSIRRLPVVRGDKLVGIVTDRDIKEWAPSKASTLEKHEMLNALSKSIIKDIMTKDVITVHQDDPIERAAMLLKEHRFGGLPCVDDTGSLTGLITAVDLFELFAESMGFKHTSTRIAILVEDTPGALARMTAIIDSFHLSIISCSTFFFREKKPGLRDVIFRVTGPKSDIQAAVDKLKDVGFNVVSVLETDEAVSRDPETA